MPQEQVVPGDIYMAIRTDSSNIRCYLRMRGDVAQREAARKGFPAGIELGSIALAPCQADLQLFYEWKDLMKRLFSISCLEVFGFRPLTFSEEPGPDDERVGHA